MPVSPVAAVPRAATTTSSSIARIIALAAFCEYAFVGSLRVLILSASSIKSAHSKSNMGAMRRACGVLMIGVSACRVVRRIAAVAPI